MRHLIGIYLLLLLIPFIFSCDNNATEVNQKQVIKPMFNPQAGTYYAEQSVSISCETPGTVILYTTDSSEPTSESILYTSPILINTMTTIRAKAFKTGWEASETNEAFYNIVLPDTVATPIINPHGGTYDSPQQISMSCETSGASIRYTLNGSEPDNNSTLYSGTFEIQQTTTIKARAFKTGMVSSEISTEVFIISISNEEMVFVQAGQFTMGRTSGTGSTDELPLHQVYVPSFYIGKYEVTQEDWTVVMGYNPSHFTGNLSNPIELENWYEALVFCNKKSIMEGKTPVYSVGSSTNPDDWGSIPIADDTSWNAAICNWNSNGYRLPTEAEWEYAARGGTDTPDFIYSGSNNVSEVAWYYVNSGNSTHAVGLKQPNGLGIFDMSGNVWEWCWDWFGPYSSQFANNPVGPASGTSKILRGGAWDDNDDDGRRVASRGWWVPSFKKNNGGFRLVRSN